MSAGGAILLIDDEEVVRLVARQLLEAIGHTVEACADPAAGVAAFAAAPTRFAAVIIDYEMPGMRGPECLARLRAIDPGVRAILCTGHAGADHPGFQAVLVKPFRLAALREAIALACA
jgi:CheY-like chemotaxis protein